MKKSVIIALIIAAACIIAGMAICTAAWAEAGFDFAMLSTQKYERVRYSVEETFGRIDIEILSGDVLIRPATDGKCTVVVDEGEKILFTVNVSGDTLEIREYDTRKWYERIEFFKGDRHSVTVYLPKEEYIKLKVETGSGDISVAKGFSFGNGSIKTAAGEVDIYSDFVYKPYSSVAPEYSGQLSVSTSSGDVEITGINAQGLTVESSSGDASMTAVNIGDNMTIKTSSGEIELEGVEVKGTFKVKTSSGDIELENCDGGEIDLRSSSGDIEGSLSSGKEFDASSSSGRVRVPDSTEGGAKCRIRTSSGDIYIRLG